MSDQIPPSKSSAVVRRGMFLAGLSLVTLAFFGLIFDFLLACFWAAILAIIFRGAHEWLLRKTGRRNLSALMTCLTIILVVIIPIGLISLSLINESTLVYEKIESGELQPQKLIDDIEAQIPYVTTVLERYGVGQQEIEQRLNTMATRIVSGIGDIAVRYTQNMISLIIQSAMMLYLLFFFVRDGHKILAAVKDTLPIGDDIEEQLFRRFAVVARATLKGTVIVASVQGLIGGILFAALGIQGAILWGVLMGLLSLLPVGGSAIVWLPAAVILFIQGDVARAVIIIVVGFLVIGLVDNFLRPLLVSRDTKMPDYLVLLTTLGGLAWFGLSGFIVGPVIAALFLAFWSIAGKLFGGEV